MKKRKRTVSAGWTAVLCFLMAAVTLSAEPANSGETQDPGSVMRRIKYVNGEKVVVDEMRLDHLKPDETFSPCPGVRVTRLSDAEAERRLRKGAPRPRLTDGWVSEFYTDFESGTWDANLIKRTLSGGYTWGRVRYNPYQGTYCCWCADKESQGYPEKDAETDYYGNNMDAWLEYPDFDTRGCDNGTLSFLLWYLTPEEWDYVNVLFSEYWEGYEWYGDSDGWQLWEFDLDDWGPESRNLMGFESLRMVFKFASNALTVQKGAFLDNVDLRKRFSAGAADLVVSALSGTPSGLDQGDLLTLNATVLNQGGTRSGETNLKYYLSQDAMITSSDHQIGTGSVFALDPSESQNLQAMINIPTDVPDGDYYLGAIVDEEDNVFEDDETNNTYVVAGNQFAIGETGVPDLIVSALNGSPSSLAQGDALAINATVLNQGSAASGATDLKYYLSADMTVAASDYLIGTVSVNALAAGGSQLFQTLVNIPGSLPDGNYYLGAIVDEANNVSEDDETNNTCVAGGSQFTIGPAGAPDLVIGNVVLNPSTGQAGTSTEVSFELRNIGTASAGAPHNARIYWSTDNSAGPVDDEMTTVAVFDIIPAGGVQNISRDVNILQGTPAGNYYVVVVADADGNVNESNENNNEGFASFIVQGTGVGTASGAVPSEYFLSDNYPNPFNPSTTIAFGVPEKASVRLSVYDTSGRLVRILVQENMSAGEYRVQWDSRDHSGTAVPSGVYFYHLRAGGFSRSGKMVLMD